MHFETPGLFQEMYYNLLPQHMYTEVACICVSAIFNQPQNHWNINNAVPDSGGKVKCKWNA